MVSNIQRGEGVSKNLGFFKRVCWPKAKKGEGDQKGGGIKKGGRDHINHL